ncbi:MAG: 3-isopropylmalate dehydratase [Proteobacteria bacterium]|nr:3-isopropylmalate dehydratase [Pseudomonadota bacterium]
MGGQGGRAWVFGDDIDTDTLAPGLYLKRPIDELARHCLEAVDPGFAAGVQPGDVVVAGRNFGMGSSREQAVEALRHLGVDAVVAESFAGIFYRNAFNLGLLALICPGVGRIGGGDRVAVDGEAGVVRNLSTGETWACEPVPAHLMDMVRDGGLVPHLEKRLAARR